MCRRPAAATERRRRRRVCTTAAPGHPDAHLVQQGRHLGLIAALRSPVERRGPRGWVEHRWRAPVLAAACRRPAPPRCACSAVQPGQRRAWEHAGAIQVQLGAGQRRLWPRSPRCTGRQPPVGLQARTLHHTSPGTAAAVLSLTWEAPVRAASARVARPSVAGRWAAPQYRLVAGLFTLRQPRAQEPGRETLAVGCAELPRGPAGPR